ncbi:MAG: lipoyl synthase [Tissierellia bacterium]|nr:lipoyl synthase [Tissierellia bacterium]
MVLKKPDWIKVKIEGSGKLAGVENLVKDLKLNTVCHSANCPNRMECFERRTATFMILGDKCTRNCRYCNVLCQKPDPVDPTEPKHIKEAVDVLDLKHAVITSVTRDDLPDEGATQFRDVIREIRSLGKNITVEVLIPDMHAKKEHLDIVFDERPDVLNHNVEAVPSIFKQVRPQGNFEQSMEVLRYAKERGLITKSGFMVGLGETKEEVLELLEKLREVDCDMVTIGQYLQPSRKHVEVSRYVHPDEFEEYKRTGLELGFKRVSSGPFVRSSYGAQAL